LRASSCGTVTLPSLGIGTTLILASGAVPLTRISGGQNAADGIQPYTVDYRRIPDFDGFSDSSVVLLRFARACREFHRRCKLLFTFP